MSALLFQLTGVRVEYGGIVALDDVDVRVNAGEILSLMGPNGAGKSTLLRAMFGLTVMTKGNVEWEGQRITPVPHEMVERGISFVPQGKRVFPHLSVEDNMLLGGLRFHARQRRDRLERLLDFFPDLRHKRSALARDLSGGQQQMVSIGRGLMNDPRLLLLDEPTLGLSPKLVKEVFGKVTDIRNTFGVTVVVVEHNLKSLFTIADRCMVLSAGRVVADDVPDIVMRSRVVEEALLGTVESH